jgi:prepilin-type N-terminal cleavage/methylation domain-containing protein
MIPCNNTSRGFTLIEMMISAFILALITTYMTSALLQQSRGYEVVDDVAEAQQTERAIGELMERDVLATGMLIAAGGVIAGVDNATPAGAFATDVLCVTDADAIGNPTVLNDANLGIEIVGGYTGSGSNSLVLGSASLEGAPAYDNSNPANGSLDSDFYFSPGSGQAGGVIVTNPADPAFGAQCGLITNVSIGAGTTVTVSWQVNFNGQDLVPGGSETPVTVTPGVRMLAIPAHIYFIRPGAAGRAPQLIRDGLLLADDVEDLQVAYFHDDATPTPNGACDANEWSGGDCPDPGVQGFNAYDSSAKDNCFLRAVRFNLVVRTADQDTVVAQNAALAQSVFVQTENAPARPGLDGFRRRVFSRTVVPRNTPLAAGSSPRGCN